MFIANRVIDSHSELYGLGRDDHPQYSLENRHAINVKDFGAVGDGSTDDTIAIQNALNYGAQNGWVPSSTSVGFTAAKGTAIYIPSGVYKTTQPLEIKPCTKVYGDGIGSMIAAYLSNDTQGIFQIRTNAAENSSIQSLGLWNVSGYGIDCTSGVNNFIVRDVEMSTNNWAIYGGDSGYCQNLVIDRVVVRRHGSGAAWLAGNLNFINGLYAGGAGLRSNFDPSGIPALLVVKGNGWDITNSHFAADGVTAISVGGEGPAYNGYGTRHINISKIWVEGNAGIPTVPGYLYKFIDCNTIHIDSVSQMIYVSGVKDFHIDKLSYGNHSYTDIDWPSKVIDFDDNDNGSIVTCNFIDKTSRIDSDPIESRIKVLGSYSTDSSLYQQFSNSYIGRFGNILKQNPSLSQGSSDASLSYERINNIGWCYKLVWTTNPTNFYLTWTLDTPSGVISPNTDAWFGFILDWNEWHRTDANGIIVNPSFGGSSINTGFTQKGPCYARIIQPTNLAGSLTTVVYGASGTIYIKDPQFTIGGIYTPNTPPTNLYQYSNGQTTSYGNSIPSTGYYTTGSIVYNNTPTISGIIGWTCISGGNPGVWTDFGATSGLALKNHTHTVSNLSDGANVALLNALVNNFSGVLLARNITHTRGFSIDNNASVITSGIKGNPIEILASGYITSWSLIGDASGNIQFDLEKGTPSSSTNYPSNWSSIVASAPPILTNQRRSYSETLTGWSPYLNQNDLLRARVVSDASGITNCTLSFNFRTH